MIPQPFSPYLINMYAVNTKFNDHHQEDGSIEPLVLFLLISGEFLDFPSSSSSSYVSLFLGLILER